MRRLRPASPLRTPLRRLPRRERLNEPHLTRTGGSGARVGAVWGMDGRGVVLVGLLWRSGAGACPNLPQRRPGPGSAAKKSAEYQRFFSRAPARSGPLWQIWTTLAAADPREPPGRAPRAGRWPGQASGRAAPGRATTTTGTPASEQGPQATETASPDDPRRRNVHFALESAVPTVILECKMHHSRAKCTSRRAGDRRPRPGHRRPRPRPGASPVTLREGAQRSLPHRKQWPGGRDRRDPGPAQTRTRLAPCEPGATKSTSARAMRAQRDEIRLRSIRASPPGTMRSQVTSPKRLPPGRARVASAGSSPPGRARAASFREGAEVSRPLGGREVVGPLVAGALRAHRVPAAARRDGGGRPAAGAVDDVGASHIPHGR